MVYEQSQTAEKNRKRNIEEDRRRYDSLRKCRPHMGTILAESNDSIEDYDSFICNQLKHNSTKQHLTNVFKRFWELNEHNSTFIHHVASRGWLNTLKTIFDMLGETAEWMLEKQDNYGMTALHYAALAKHTDVSKCLLLLLKPDCQSAVLLMHGQGLRNILHYAALKADHDLIKEIMNLKSITIPEASEMIAAQDQNGMTPIHYAAGNGQTNVLKTMLNWLPSMLLGMKMHKSQTPVDMARNKNHIKAVHFMKSYFSEVDQCEQQVELFGPEPASGANEKFKDKVITTLTEGNV